MRRRRISYWILLLFCLGGATACQSAADNTFANPPVLRFGYSPSDEEAEKQVRRMDMLQKYLVKQLGMPVEMFKTSAYAPMVEAMLADKVDAASLGPFAFLIAESKGIAELLAIRGSKEGEPGVYRSVIATHSRTGLRSLEDVKRKAADLTLSFTDPASNSGHLVPRAQLVSMGLEPEKHFKKVMFSMSHLASAMTLKAEKVDVAGMMQATLENLIKTGKIRPEEIVILWTSEPVPTSPLAVRTGLAPELKKKLQDAFVHMHELDPELSDTMRTITAAPDSIYLRGDRHIFDGLRSMAQSMPGLKLLEP